MLHCSLNKINYLALLGIGFYWILAAFAFGVPTLVLFTFLWGLYTSTSVRSLGGIVFWGWSGHCNRFDSEVSGFLVVFSGFYLFLIITSGLTLWTLENILPMARNWGLSMVIFISMSYSSKLIFMSWWRKRLTLPRFCLQKFAFLFRLKEVKESMESMPKKTRVCCFLAAASRDSFSFFCFASSRSSRNFCFLDSNIFSKKESKVLGESSRKLHPTLCCRR